MRFFSIATLVVSTTLLSTSHAFTTTNSKVNHTKHAAQKNDYIQLMNTSGIVVEKNDSRRTFLSQLASTSFFALTTFSAKPAFADVSDGNTLPDGAAQFSRLVRLKSNLVSLIERLTNNPDDVNSKEWDNLSDFLRVIYKGGEDMKSISKASIFDPEKKKQADEDIKLIQKLAQAGDAIVSKQDVKSLLDVFKKSLIILDNFNDLLRDVPDEI